jgi:hypothetical protein
MARRRIKLVLADGDGRSESTIAHPHVTDAMIDAARRLIGVMSGARCVSRDELAVEIERVVLDEARVRELGTRGAKLEHRVARRVVALLAELGIA